jgi:CO dehydrogenase/acetyl-CoA synthase beta subunit
MQRADSGRRAQEQETVLSDQHRSHIEAEYEMYLRKEQLRIDFVNQSQEIHRNAMDELQKAIAEVDQVRQRTLLEKETIEQEIERCNEAINKFQVHTEHFEGVCEHILLEHILLLATCLLCCKVCPRVPEGVCLTCCCGGVRWSLGRSWTRCDGSAPKSSETSATICSRSSLSF